MYTYNVVKIYIYNIIIRIYFQINNIYKKKKYN